jgi:hypothetical protein
MAATLDGRVEGDAVFEAKFMRPWQQVDGIRLSKLDLLIIQIDGLHIGNDLVLLAQTRRFESSMMADITSAISTGRARSVNIMRSANMPQEDYVTLAVVGHPACRLGGGSDAALPIQIMFYHRAYERPRSRPSLSVEARCSGRIRPTSSQRLKKTGSLSFRLANEQRDEQTGIRELIGERKSRMLYADRR